MKDIRDDIERISKNVKFIANALDLRLPESSVNYHDCRIYDIQMSSNEDGDLFLGMNNAFQELVKVQVKFCPLCGFEGNEPPLFKLSNFPRK